MVSKLDKWLAEKADSLPKWLQTYIILIACVTLFALMPVLIALPIWVIVHGNIVLGIILAIFVSGPLMTVLLTGEDDDGWH